MVSSYTIKLSVSRPNSRFHEWIEYERDISNQDFAAIAIGLFAGSTMQSTCAIAIGNGTASRETEALVKKIKFDRSLQVFIVSEDGASIYSASKVAREEFPQFDVTVRGAISIG